MKSGHQVVTLKHEGKPLTFIIDTGAGAAGANLVSNETAKKLNLKKTGEVNTSRGVGSDQVMNGMEPFNVQFGTREVPISDI